MRLKFVNMQTLWNWLVCWPFLKRFNAAAPSLQNLIWYTNIAIYKNFTNFHVCLPMFRIVGFRLFIFFIHDTWLTKKKTSSSSSAFIVWEVLSCNQFYQEIICKANLRVSENFLTWRPIYSFFFLIFHHLRVVSFTRNLLRL